MGYPIRQFPHLNFELYSNLHSYCIASIFPINNGVGFSGNIIVTPKATPGGEGELPRYSIYLDIWNSTAYKPYEKKATKRRCETALTDIKGPRDLLKKESKQRQAIK